MAWGIDLNTTRNPLFRSLRWRLLLSYLVVMAAILGTAGVTVYGFFVRSLYHQLNDELQTLAQVAAPSLTTFKSAGIQNPNQNIHIPWRSLRDRDQSLEWFSTNKQLLAREGATFPALPLQVDGETLQRQGQRLTLTLPVYEYDSRGTRLQGYVRASQATETIYAVLQKLNWGLGIGGAIALVLTGLGGMWLTRQALKPTEQSFQQLKQFTADASHELRSPLTGIKTSIEVVLSHPERVHPLDAKKLTSVIRTTNHMARLLEDLLLLARTDITTSLLTAEWGPVPLDEVLQDLVERVEPQALSKEITLQSLLLPGLSVTGDGIQLTRLFANLLENALQYTPTGKTVTLSMESFDRFLVVSVEDTGIGIASEHLPLVFNRFWRADQARSQHRGFGLGLALAQALAQYHGGEITVSSQVGVGSCFCVRLPLI